MFGSYSHVSCFYAQETKKKGIRTLRKPISHMWLPMCHQNEIAPRSRWRHQPNVETWWIGKDKTQWRDILWHFGGIRTKVSRQGPRFCMDHQWYDQGTSWYIWICKEVAWTIMVHHFSHIFLGFSFITKMKLLKTDAKIRTAKKKEKSININTFFQRRVWKVGFKKLY